MYVGKGIKRTIEFYRLEAIDPAESKKISRQLLSEAIRNIDPALTTSHVQLAEGERLQFWNDTENVDTAEHLKMCLGKVKEKDIPGTVLDGAVRSEIDAKNILHPVHIVMFRRRIIGAEVYKSGPRLFYALPHYFRQICPQLPDMKLKPLYKKNVLDQLKGLKEVQLLSLDLDLAFELPEKPDLGTGLLNLVKAKYPSKGSTKKELRSGFTTAQLVLKFDKGENLPKDKALRPKVKEARNQVAEEFTEAALSDVFELIYDAQSMSSLKNLTLIGYKHTPSGRRSKEKLDLVDIESNRVSTARTIKAQSDSAGVVNKEDAYSKIIDAFDECEDWIKKALDK